MESFGHSTIFSKIIERKLIGPKLPTNGETLSKNTKSQYLEKNSHFIYLKGDYKLKTKKSKGYSRWES